MNALKPTTPRCRHLRHVADTEPGTRPPHSAKSVIDAASSAARLRSNSRGVDRARRRVERHVEEQRAAAGRQRAAAGRRAFPLGAARLVEVQVHVDQAGQHEQAARIDLLARRPAAPAPIVGDAPVLDRDVGRAARRPA